VSFTENTLLCPVFLLTLFLITFGPRAIDIVKCPWSSFFYLQHFSINYFTLHYISPWHYISRCKVHCCVPCFAMVSSDPTPPGKSWNCVCNISTTWNTHTHTHLTAIFPGLPRWAASLKAKTNLDFTEARDSEWQWHQLEHMQVCTSLQTDSHASTSPLSFYRPDALPAAQPTVSKHWRQSLESAGKWVRSQKVLEI